MASSSATKPFSPGLFGRRRWRMRASSARAAVALMGGLIEAHGQFGSGLPGQGYGAGGYDNSFIAADAAEAWILESAGTRWAARRLTHGYASISNQLSIRGAWDLGSGDLEAYAVAQGWWPVEQAGAFDFAHAYTDEQVPRQVSHLRARRSQQLLAERAGQITPAWMQRVARDHYEDTFLGGPYFDAADPDFLTLCMHVSPAGFTWGNTASSSVAVLPAAPGELPVFWWTPGPPCNGCYVPFFVHGHRLPEIVSRAGTVGTGVTRPEQTAPDNFSAESYWWLFRRLMDAVKGDAVRSVPACYTERNRRVREVFDILEQQFEAELPLLVSRVGRLAGQGDAASAQLLDEYTDQCVRQVVRTVERLLAEFGAAPTEP
jgi:secernin